MSDFGVEGRPEGRAEGGPEGEGVSQLAEGSLADYIITFLSGDSFYAGEDRPIRWQISLDDGNVDAPMDATIVVYNLEDEDSAGEDTVLLDPEPPAGTQIVGCQWSVPELSEKSYFRARLTVVMTDAVRIHEQNIAVLP